MSGSMARMSGPTIPDLVWGGNFRIGAEMDDSKGKIGEILWMEIGERWGKARSTCNTRNPWIKFNKTSSHQQITKKIGTIFVGQFRIRTKNNKIKLENTG